MTIQVVGSDLRVLNMRTRFPFRYGITALTALPHLLVQLTVDVDGLICTGIASEGLAPKWFTKNPDSSVQQDLTEMLDVITHAVDSVTDGEPCVSVFELWHRLYRVQEMWADARAYPPLLWNLGVSLVERALIDAYCSAKSLTFAEAVHSNALGIQLHAISPELGGEPADYLPQRPLASIRLRHTVGLGDPLLAAEVLPAQRVDDGLPQSLDECIDVYGLTRFKIKVNGEPESDRARLGRLAALLDASAGSDYAFTLDGNEQYMDVEAFRTFWNALQSDATLSRFLDRLLFVEQPLNRKVALSDETAAALHGWPERPPLIIDESDGSLDSLPRALACGYAGTSHKNCKGVFKGIINACRLEAARRRNPSATYIMSAEDLANVGPVALLQDLAVLATLGIPHAERNGHHYFRGLSMYPPPVQEQTLAAHGDLYHRHASGFAAVHADAGLLKIQSLLEAPLGVGFALDVTQFTPLADWTFASLSIGT